MLLNKTNPISPNFQISFELIELIQPNLYPGYAGCRLGHILPTAVKSKSFTLLESNFIYYQRVVGVVRNKILENSR